jgi:monofunctional biosynthetic peptidoglycan transglycosylase
MASEMASKPLVDFSDKSASKQWISVNDNVMGGISEGQFRITDKKTLEFSGNLSLENNGGFASIRTQPAELNLDGYDTIGLTLKGDGRMYYFNARTSSRNRASSYRVPIKTQTNTWQDIHIPLNTFVYTSFGRVVNGAKPLKAKDIQSVGFTLSDKKSDPFKLEVSEIRATKTTVDNTTATSDEPDDSVESKDIIDTAIAASTFESLVAAVKAAGLVEALKDKGPFTVFACSK